VKEASKIHQQLNDAFGQAHCLGLLGWLLYDDQQFDTVEEAASQSINLLPEKSDQSLVCNYYRLLGEICSSKGDTEKAISHFEAALRTASAFGWYYEQFLNHHSLAVLFLDQGRFDDSRAHIECSKLHAVNNLYLAARTMRLQADFWYRQDRLREARSEALRAADALEKVGATRNLETCRGLLRDIEEAMEKSTTPAQGTKQYRLRLFQFLQIFHRSP